MTTKRESHKHIEEQIESVRDEVYSLDLVTSTSILPDEKIKALREIKDDLLASFKKRQVFRPKYLMEVSVLKDTRFPTPDAKYWQCLLERDVMFQNLMSLSFDYREKLLDVETKQLQLEEIEPKTKRDIIAREKLNIQIKKDMFQLALMRKEAEERFREIKAWTDLIEELKPKLKYSEDNPEEHMPESFLIRFAAEKQMIDQIGAADMNGAMNTLGLGQTAARYWKERKEKKGSDEK